jgi:PhnB protein
LIGEKIEMSKPENDVRMLAPHLVCDGAGAAIEFYKTAFGAEEMMRLPGPDGRLMHGAVTINGGIVMLVDEFCGPDDEASMRGARSPKSLGGTPVTIHLSVPNVDAVVSRAVEAGAQIVMPVADQFWGDRYGIVEDPFGHRWSVSTPLRTPMSEAELQEAARAVMG